MKKGRWISPKTDELFTAILGLRNLDEARRFFRDLLTAEEIKEFANRWKVAQMLADKITYEKIGKKTGMSSTTIARISKWLSNGCDGYNLLISRRSHSHHPLTTHFRED